MKFKKIWHNILYVFYIYRERENTKFFLKFCENKSRNIINIYNIDYYNYKSTIFHLKKKKIKNT